MADPLSITASIVAVITATEGISIALLKLKSLYNAPSEVLAVINELSDLGIIFGHIERYLAQIAYEPQSQVSQDQLETLAGLVKSATSTLREVNQLIQFRLIKLESTPQQAKVSRREWLRLKPKFNQVRQTLENIRRNVATHMVVLNSWVFIVSKKRSKMTLDAVFIIYMSALHLINFF